MGEPLQAIPGPAAFPRCLPSRAAPGNIPGHSRPIILCSAFQLSLRLASPDALSAPATGGRGRGKNPSRPISPSGERLSAVSERPGGALTAPQRRKWSTRTHTRTHTGTHARTHARTDTAHTHTHTHTHTRTHTRTHAFKHSLLCLLTRSPCASKWRLIICINDCGKTSQHAAEPRFTDEHNDVCLCVRWLGSDSHWEVFWV